MMVDDNAPAIESDPAELSEAIANRNADIAQSWLEDASHRDAVHALAALTDDERGALLRMLSSEAAADVIDHLPESLAADAIEELDARTAASIIGELQSDDQADLINALADDNAEAILASLSHDDADELRTLASYDDDTAGGLMLTEYLAYPEGNAVRDVLADLELHANAYADYNIQYTYVIDSDGRLTGVLPIRRLLLANRSAVLRDLMIADPLTVTDDEPLEELSATFDAESFLGLPVVDEDGVMLGVVERQAVSEARADVADNTYLASQGIVGGEELRSMPVLLRARRRLAWLSINIVLNIAAASIIAIHQGTLEAVIALAVFLPIISDMSGCSGNQAVAVSMRELTLGVTRATQIFRVLIKESAVGIINGICLGGLIGLVAFVWKGNAALGLVVGTALCLNTLLAVCIGGSIPLLLNRFKMDPALASGPILTTITDMCGFLLVLSLASASMQHLTG